VLVKSVRSIEMFQLTSKSRQRKYIVFFKFRKSVPS